MPGPLPGARRQRGLDRALTSHRLWFFVLILFAALLACLDMCVWLTRGIAARTKRVVARAR